MGTSRELGDALLRVGRERPRGAPDGVPSQGSAEGFVLVPEPQRSGIVFVQASSINKSFSYAKNYL